MTTALKVEKLYKSYGQNEVLKEISFDVKKGEIFGVLGVNGAGKTTLLECIEGIRRYDKGNIEILEKPQKQGLLGIGVQLQSSTLPSQIKVKEAIKLYSMWNNRKDSADAMRYGLSEIKNKKYSELSTGQKRRLHLALATISDPEILFLDEPTAGLDVEGRAALHLEIRKMKAAGKTIILASHDMAEVEALCDRVAMIGGGKIVFLGSVNEFTAINKGNFKVHIKLSGKTEYLVFEIDDINSGLIEVLNRQKQSGEKITDIKIERPTLEESFLTIAKEVKK